MRSGHKASVVHLSDGKQIVTRSALEARWATFFTELGLGWIYEPVTFELKDGRTYTPDFNVAGVGLIEIKPTLDLLVSENGHKIEQFCRERPEFKLYAICADKVGFDCVAKFQEGKIFSCGWEQMARIFARARYKSMIYDSPVAASIHNAITKANRASVDHMVSTKSLVLGLVEKLTRHPSLAAQRKIVREASEKLKGELNR